MTERSIAPFDWPVAQLSSACFDSATPLPERIHKYSFAAVCLLKVSNQTRSFDVSD